MGTERAESSLLCTVWWQWWGGPFRRRPPSGPRDGTRDGWATGPHVSRSRGWPASLQPLSGACWVWLCPDRWPPPSTPAQSASRSQVPGAPPGSSATSSSVFLSSGSLSLRHRAAGTQQSRCLPEPVPLGPGAPPAPNLGPAGAGLPWALRPSPLPGLSPTAVADGEVGHAGLSAAVPVPLSASSCTQGRTGAEEALSTGSPGGQRPGAHCGRRLRVWGPVEGEHPRGLLSLSRCTCSSRCLRGL